MAAVDRATSGPASTRSSRRASSAAWTGASSTARSPRPTSSPGCAAAAAGASPSRGPRGPSSGFSASRRTGAGSAPTRRWRTGSAAPASPSLRGTPGANPENRSGSLNTRTYAESVTHDVNVLLAVLGVAGQVVLAGLAIVGSPRARRRAPAARRRPPGSLGLRALARVPRLRRRRPPAASSTPRSPDYVPCELCWFQRICMYPLSILTLLIGARERPPRGALPAAAADRRRRARDLPHARRARRRRPDGGLLDLGARRLRHEVDRRVRLPDDPDPDPHRLSPSSSRSCCSRVRLGPTTQEV